MWKRKFTYLCTDQYLRHYISRDDTLALGPELVDWALDLVFEVWPLYRFYLAGRG